MTTEPKGLTDADIAELRELAVAVLADRLYVLGNEDKCWANRELVERWNATITPVLILQLTRAYAAGAASVPNVPREPTESMISAGYGDMPTHVCDVVEIWQAMHDAAREGK